MKMAQLIGESLDKEPKITLAPALLGEVTHYVADITKARELLGYDPKVPLEQGIPTAVGVEQRVGKGAWKGDLAGSAECGVRNSLWAESS